jgi:hypothetical protein
MDSQTTLVAPASEPTYQQLIFTPDNVRNTTITLRNSTVYTVKSAKDYTWTEISDASGSVVSKIVYHTIMPDTVCSRA